MPAENPDLHGNVPENSPVVLLLIDVIYDMEFPGAEKLMKHAVPMARKLAALKARARKARVPSIYVNDNFGRWQSDFHRVVEHCLNALILTSIAGNMCILFSANDAYMRDFNIIVPSDCVASNTKKENDHALVQIRTVLKGDVRLSKNVRFR